MKKISMVISAYNEEQGLRHFHEVCDAVLRCFCAGRYEYDFCFVNDGSADQTGRILEELRKQDPSHIRVISFSRNFGHEAAMCAGLDYADGDYLIFMDADLQHPPASIPAIMQAFEEGANVINMVRTKNETAGLIKNLTSKLFYWMINLVSDIHLEPAASDFFALDRMAAKVLREHYREKIRFLRGYVQNIGFHRVCLEYEAAPRTAGESHYSLRKLFRLCMNTLISFSDRPLKCGIYAGLFTALCGVLLIIYTLLTREGAPDGYTTIVIVLCFMFSVLFMLTGIIGQYISVIYAEIKDRPIYIVKDMILGDVVSESDQHVENA